MQGIIRVDDIENTGVMHGRDYGGSENGYFVNVHCNYHRCNVLHFGLSRFWECNQGLPRGSSRSAMYGDTIRNRFSSFLPKLHQINACDFVAPVLWMGLSPQIRSSRDISLYCAHILCIHIHIHAL